MRDLDTVDSELRLLAAVRRSIREHVGEPSSRQVDNSSMSAWRNFAGPARSSRSTHSPPGAVPHSTQEMCESYTFVELAKERRLNVGPPLGADSLTGIAQPRSRLMASGRRPPASTRPRGR